VGVFRVAVEWISIHHQDSTKTEMVDLDPPYEAVSGQAPEESKPASFL
jgi:hypothetical protein